MELIKVTRENYYSEEVNKQYLSSHSFMDYLDDSGTFWLKQHGYLTQTESRSLIAGTIFHAFMESEEEFYAMVDKYKKEFFSKVKKDDVVSELIKENGIEAVQSYKYNDMVDIWTFIQDNWENRHEIWRDIDGWENEVILTGEIGGVPYKGRIDKLFINKEENKAIILDYKTMALKDYYGQYFIDGKRYEMTFLHQYNYDLQMTVYRLLVAQNYDIPFENVKVQFKLLVKSGKKQFAEYPYGYVTTELLDDEKLAVPRFGDDMTAEDVLYNYSQYAYDMLSSKEVPNDVKRKSVIYNMVAKRKEPMDVEQIKL